MSPLVQDVTPTFNEELTQIINTLEKTFNSSNIQLPEEFYNCLRRIIKLFTEILKMENYE